MKNKYYINQILIALLALSGCNSKIDESNSVNLENKNVSKIASSSPNESGMNLDPIDKSNVTQSSKIFIATWSGPTFPAVDLANRGRFKIENGCVVVYVGRNPKSATVIFPKKTRLSDSDKVEAGLTLPNGQNLKFGVEYSFSGDAAESIPANALATPIPKQCPQAVFAIGDIMP